MRQSQQNTGPGLIAADCEAIDLDSTNRLARMLVRTDRKYLLNFEQFRALASDISELYYVLEIDGISQFSYLSCYYDDQFRCYLEHHQARRQRIKVRTREYVDSGLRFFEVKLKGLRGLTRKHRVTCDDIVMPVIGGRYLDMLRGLYADQYHKPMNFSLTPSLLVGYKRCTLVLRQGGERVTIDYGLTFRDLGSRCVPVQLDNNFIIVETKSKDGRGVVDRSLKRMGIRRARRCSKYCVGVNLTGAVRKNNNFLHTIRQARRNIIDEPTARRVAVS